MNILGQSALHFAISTKNLNLVEILVQNYSTLQINQNNSKGLNPLQVAINTNNTKIIQTLLTHDKINIFQIDRLGNNALHNTAKLGNTILVQYFLNKFKNINCLNSDDQTPLHLAAQRDQTEVIKILVLQKEINLTQQDFVKKFSCLHSAIGCGNEKALRILLGAFIAHKKSLKTLTGYEYTPLHIAVSNKDLKIIQLLFKFGLHTQINTPSTKNLITPLYLAILHHAGEDIIQFLIENGANIDFVNLVGNSPRTLVQEYNFNYMEKIVLETKSKL